jgi:hypothetical protein
MRLMITFVSVLAVSACGAKDQGKSATKPFVTEEAAKAQSQSLPAVTIVRVPVDASGQEIHGQAEMRLASEKSISKDNIEAAFAGSTVPETVVDELDQSSSTESFCGWRQWRRRCFNNCGAFNYNYGYNYSFGQNYNWAFYRPTYYNYGYYYNWNFAQTYNAGGFNYYQYNSSFANGYSGFGAAPGFATPY